MAATTIRRKAEPKVGVGERLKRMRLGKNLTQTELAEKAKVSADTVNKLEGGRTQPQPLTVRKLAAALGVEAENLTGGVGR